MNDRLRKILADHPVNDLRFIIPMQQIHGISLLPGIGITSSDSPTERKICKIDESRYQIKDNYKIELRAIDDQDPDNYFGSRSYYLSDLQSLMESHPEEFVVFVPMPLDKFVEITSEWAKRSSHDSRLGQALINALEPRVVDPEIFYEVDDKKATELFLNRYVNNDPKTSGES